MNSTIKNLPKSQVEISVKIDKSEMDVFITKTAKDLSKTLSIKGFRKGEAPQEVVEKHIGHPALYAEAIELAVNESYKQAVLQHKITPIERASINLDEKQDKDSVSYTAITSVMPEITLPDYRKIAKSVKKEEVVIEDKELQESRDYLQKSRAKFITEDKSAEKSDNISINLEVIQDNKVIDSIQGQSFILGDGGFIKGFEDNIEGLKAGNKKEFELTFPKEYHNEEVSGKKALFKVEVTLVQKVELPQWNDEFAQGLGAMKNVEELEKNLKEGLMQEKTLAVETKRKNDIVEQILDTIKVELPDVLVKAELEQILHEMQDRASQAGDSLEAYLERTGKKKEELEKELIPQAESRTRLMLALKEISEAEEFKNDDDVVLTEMASVLSRYPKKEAQKIDQDRLRLMIEGEMMDKKVLDFLGIL